MGMTGGIGQNKAVPPGSTKDVGFGPNENSMTKIDNDISKVSTLDIFTKDKAVTISEYNTLE